MSYEIFNTYEFNKKIIKYFDSKELIKFEKFRKKLIFNPYLGDQLRVSFVREFKTKKGKRAYFIIYKDYKKILFIGLGNKKNQKEIIDSIFNNLDEYNSIIANF